MEHAVLHAHFQGQGKPLFVAGCGDDKPIGPPTCLATTRHIHDRSTTMPGRLGRGGPTAMMTKDAGRGAVSSTAWSGDVESDKLLQRDTAR